MKWLSGLLLLSSLAFFAIIQWGKSAEQDARPLPPLNAEKIRLLPFTPAAASAVQPTACMEWSIASAGDLKRAAAAISALGLSRDQFTQRQAEHASGYWVYIPPLKTHAEVEKKIAQIKALGVDEYFVVQENGKWRNAISLGLFKTMDAAQKFLDSLRGKGVKSAVAGARSGDQESTVFVLKNPDLALTERMVAVQKEFPGSELKATACTSD